MSGTDYTIAPRIPRGLAPAVEGLAREILRERPRNIYAFAAEYFKELVVLRDKECTGGIVSRVLDCKSLDERDRIPEWSGFNNSDFDSVKNGTDQPRVCKYGDLIEKMMLTKESVTSTIARKTVLSKKKKETSNLRSGWSINRTVKVFKKHEYNVEDDVEESGKFWNMQTSEKPIEKMIPDQPEHHSSGSSRKMNCGRLLRSSSVGNIFTKTIKRRLRENREKLYTFALEKYAMRNIEQEYDKSHRNTNKLMRQNSADQIEEISTHFRAGTNEDVIHVVGRRRSRSLVNNENGNETDVGKRMRRQYYTTECETSQDLKDERKEQKRKEKRKEERKEQRKELQKEDQELQEKFDNRGESITNWNLRLGKKIEEEESRDKKMGETFNSESRSDLSQSSNAIDGGMDAMIANRTISIVLPLVDTRLPFEKCLRNNLYETNSQNSTNNLTLPPISSDGLKSMKKESNLTLPRLPTDIDARSNERTTYCCDHVCTHPNSTGDREREFKLTGNVEATSSNYDLKGVQKECKDVEDSKLNTNDITIFGSTENTTEEKDEIDETEAMKVEEEFEIIQHLSIQEADTKEPFRDSLNVTPDSIDLSQRPDSLEYLENEKEKEEKEKVEDEQQKWYQPNELERKLIEIETVERSIENTLVVSSRTISNFNDGCEESIEGCLVGFSMENLESEKSNDVYRNEMILVTETRKQVYVEDECKMNNCEKSQSPQSGDGDGGDEDDGDSGGSIEINSVKTEMTTRKRSSDNSKIVIGGDDINRDGSNVRGTCNEISKGIDLSCYVLTEGSPCEIPETVTTVIIPDKIVDISDEVCKIEFKESTNDAVRLIDSIEMQKEYQHGKDPFGEYVRPEVFDCYLTSMDPNFLREIKDATNRRSIYQDLENIKEEEENEKDKFSNDKVVECNSKYVIDTNNIETKGSNGKAINMNDREKDFASVTIRESNSESKLKEHVKIEEDSNDGFAEGNNYMAGTTLGEQKREISNGRSDNLSQSFEEARPHVPELNLDSLRDTTTMSSIERSDSIGFENRLEKENGNTTTSLFSFDNLTFEGKPIIIDESLSSKDEFLQEEFFIKPENPKTTKVKSETGKDLKSIFQENESTTNMHFYDESEKNSRCVEEEIAKELIENFILEESVVGTESWTNSTSKYQTDDLTVKFHSRTPKGSIHKTVMKGYYHRDEVDSNAQAYTIIEKEEENGRAAGEKEEGKKETEEDRGRKEGREIVKLQHTGEFHDSLPLPLVGISKNDSTIDVYALKAACETTDCSSFTFPIAVNSTANGGCTKVANVTFSDSNFSRTVLPRVIGFLDKRPSLNLLNIDNETEFPLNFSSCTVRIDHVLFNEARTADKIVLPLVETSLDSSTDDLREPLALDNTPKSIVIEEISNVHEGEEEILPP